MPCARRDRPRGHPGGHVDYSDAHRSEFAEREPPEVAQVARQSAQIVDEDGAKRSAACVRHQPLEVRTIGVGTGDRCIPVLGKDTVAALQQPLTLELSYRSPPNDPEPKAQQRHRERRFASYAATGDRA